MRAERSYSISAAQNNNAAALRAADVGPSAPSSSSSVYSVRAAPGKQARGAVILQCGPNFEHNWYGRLGNNIISIFNAALDAESRGLDFSLKDCSHSILNLAPYDYYSRKHPKATPIKQVLTPAEAFYINIYNYPRELDGLELLLPFPAACCSRKRILSPPLAKFYTSPAAFKFSQESLIIHIRSGDIFDRTRPAEFRYSPPPLAYYTGVIEEHQSRHSRDAKVVIVTETNNMSPLVEALLKLYPEGMITLQAGTLEEDVAVVLAARHLVASQGTFAYALALASHNLDTLYLFNNIVHALDDRAFCDVQKVHTYSPRGGKYLQRWEASEAQVQYLMNFQIEDLVEAVVEGSNSTCFFALSL